MHLGPILVIRGALLGSLLLGMFGWIVSAHAAPLAEAPAAAPAAAAVEAPVPEVPASGETIPVDLPIQEGAPAELLGSTEAEADSGDCEVSSAFPANILQWCELITHYAEKRGLEPDLVAAVMLQESGGNATAYSHSGAVGLMQVMPRDGIAARFQCINGPCFASRPTIAELQDPEFNIEYGTGMLANLEGRYGNIRDALKAYGPMDMGYRYADKVLSIFENYGN